MMTMWIPTPGVEPLETSNISDFPTLNFVLLTSALSDVTDTHSCVAPATDGIGVCEGRVFTAGGRREAAVQSQVRLWVLVLAVAY